MRLIIPGWPGSVSSKWLTRIWVRDKVHDGPGMGGTSYRVTIKPMIPGGKPDESNFRDLELMPVRSIITSPANGTKLAGNVARAQAARRGVGRRFVDPAGRRVDRLRRDLAAGAIAAAKNRYDWRRWTATVRVPSEGYYEIWTRATDQRGAMQPHIAGNWNPQGYGANPMHRIAVLIG